MSIVTVDANIWISGLQFSKGRSVPWQALEQARRDDVIATCEALESEVSRILQTDFGWTENAVRMALEYGMPRLLRTQPTGVVRVCRDPDDDAVLECALLSASEFLVTGDKDLLSIGIFEDVRIITAAEYVRGRH